MIRHKLLILLAIAGTAEVAAEDLSLGPVIEDYGPTYAIEWRDVELPEGQRYKLVFDLAADADNLRVACV